MIENGKEIIINEKNVKRIQIGENIIWEKNNIEQFSFDYYISTTGSNDNDGKTLETAFADLTGLVDVVDNGDVVFIDGGTYNCPTTSTISKAITLIGSEDNKPTFISKTSSNFILNFNLQNETNQSLNLKNINFTGDTSLTMRYLVQVGYLGETNSLYVNNCDFSNGRAQYNGRVLVIYMYGGYAEIRNSSFTNNTTYGYGHSGASCMARGTAGTMRVYNCLFNNPQSTTANVFCGKTGNSISAHNENSTCNISAKGSCNQFLGEGDTCFKNYTEESCESFI